MVESRESQNAAGFRPLNDVRQEAVLRFLTDVMAQDGDVRRCDTHAAVVFLAGHRALKVKRAVRFPFLDYSTLEKRKAACEAELQVNRRFAPQLYRRIVPITCDPDGHLAIDGPGEPVEWAVEMTRFDERQTLDHVADRGEMPEGIPNQLAAMVVAMHDTADAVEAGPWIAAIDSYIEQNSSAFRRHENVFTNDAVIELDEKSRHALNRLRPLLAARGERGFVRRGHGDLHLGNIAMIQGKPVAFDAIEFDPVIASGDVLYDLAFLLMDLIERGLGTAANAVLNGYFAGRKLEDYDGLAALPLFMSLRAAIRAQVTAARLAQDLKGVRAEFVSSARRYFQLARELLQPVRPYIVCTGGLSGTGKSVLARSLAPLMPPLPGALVLRSDVERKAMFGLRETQRLPPEAYEPGVSSRLYAALNEKAIRIATAGYSVIIDAVFAETAERHAASRAARAADLNFLGFFLTADLATRLKRVQGRIGDASDADNAIARQQEAYDLGTIDWIVIDASGPPDQTLEKTRARIPAHASRDEHRGPG